MDSTKAPLRAASNSPPPLLRSSRGARDANADSTVVFDALSTSQSGIIQRELCDERRATYQDTAGSFDPDTFNADLRRAKGVVLRSFCIFPGSVIVVQAGLFYKLDGWQQWLDYYNNMLDILGPAYFGIER